MKPKIRRLRRLLAVLREVRDAEFYMGSWRRRLDPDGLFELIKKFDRPFCNTVACAAGHGALDPVLRKQGLKLSGNCIVFGIDTGTEALQHFFGLTHEQVDNIFFPDGYPSLLKGQVRPNHVIARLKEQVPALEAA